MAASSGTAMLTRVTSATTRPSVSSPGPPRPALPGRPICARRSSSSRAIQQMATASPFRGQTKFLWGLVSYVAPRNLFRVQSRGHYRRFVWHRLCARREIERLWRKGHYPGRQTGIRSLVHVPIFRHEEWLFHGYVCDIGRPESVADACGQLLAAYGAPDILINNAGFAIYRTFEQEETAEVERLMSVNFAGAIRVTKALLSGMIERRGGQIVNITSIAGSLPLTPCAVYGAAKHGIMGWSRCLSSELARFGIERDDSMPRPCSNEFLRPRILQEKTTPEGNRTDRTNGSRSGVHPGRH